MLNEIMLIILLLVGVFYWFKFQQVKEIALNAVKSHCRSMGVQMLDDYVAAKTVGWGRDKSGRLNWRSIFEFEFSSTGDDRYNGKVTLLGQRIESIYMEPHRIETRLTSTDYL